MKYFEITEDFKLSNKEDVKVYPYSKTIIGVDAADYTDFKDATKKTFIKVQSVIENSHLNKELNKLIVKRIREKYSVDDEIALLKKEDTDPKKIAYQKYVDGIKSEIDLKKIEYGIKQPNA